MKNNKKNLRVLEDIQKLHQNLGGLLGNNSLGNQKDNYVSFIVRESHILLIHITSLLEVNVIAINGNGIMLSSTYNQ